MKIKLISFLLSSVMLFNTAQASDDALWAIGGFILGTIVADNNNREHAPPREQLPPPRKQPRLVPIYSKVCQWREQYDPWDRPLPPVRTCWQEITGYREVYD
jgi:hypothetical protein